MNRPIRKVAIAIAVLFLALFVNLNVVQVFQGSNYRDNPANDRTTLNEYSSPRGQIVVQGNAVAESVKTDDELKYLRKYPHGTTFATVTGYDSIVYGPSGIEAAKNEILSGDSPQLFTSNLADILTGRDPRGGSVTLTLNAAAQKAAYTALKQPNGKARPGAIVAIDPTSGAILAAVSSPSYDPSVLSSHNSAAIQHARNCYLEPTAAIGDQRLHETDREYDARVRAEIARRESSATATSCANVPDDPTSFFKKNPTLPGPLFNRAFAGTYPPGSIFKVIVSAAALKAGYTPDQKILAPQYYWPLQPARRSACPTGDTGPCIHNFTLDNGFREECEPGKLEATLDFALEKSCNTAFAALAVHLGAAKVAAEAKLFGLDTAAPEVPLSVSRSTIGSLREITNDPVALAQTAFGQRSVAITPLQAAMISAAVANHGLLYKPYLVQNEKRPNLSTLYRAKKQQLNQVIDPNLDDKLISMMDNVVSGAQAGDEATGRSAAITDLGDSVVVGGKTGTADHQDANGNPLPADSWFSGFAMVKAQPKIAVAVLLENSDATGGEDAAPKAKQVMEAYLKSIGVGS